MTGVLRRAVRMDGRRIGVNRTSPRKDPRGGLDFAVDALACYRLTRIAQRDTFPPVAWLRARIVRPSAPDAVHELAECPWCLSFWVALGVVAARRRWPKVWHPLACALAASAVTGLASEREHR